MKIFYIGEYIVSYLSRVFLGYITQGILSLKFLGGMTWKGSESNKIQEKLDRRRNKEAKKRKREILDPDTIR